MALTAAEIEAATRLTSFYNGNAYNSGSNPGGFDNDGHRINFVPCLQDVSAMGTASAREASAVVISNTAISYNLFRGL